MVGLGPVVLIEHEYESESLANRCHSTVVLRLNRLFFFDRGIVNWIMEDDLVCEYDSTWDTESDGEDPAGESQTRRSNPDKTKSWTLWPNNSSRNMRAAKDMQNYRRGYPNLTDDEFSEDKMNNLKFYLNQYPSAPDDVYIESFHKEWKTDYKRLERVHSYIQWLFPLREPGVNYMASELTKKEIEAFKQSEEAKGRLIDSYELMLGFYGIQLVNRDTGEVKRGDNCRERFANLERNMHNNLRITRILKSLGELGFEHYQAPLVRFFLEETLVKKNLSSVKRSVLDYFLFAVLDKQKRRDLLRFAYQHFEPKDKFVWCPRKIQKQLKRRPEGTGNAEGKEESRTRVKGKDTEGAGTQKDETVDKAKADKAEDGDNGKLPKDAPESQTENSTVENGKEEPQMADQPLENANGCDDNNDMELSESLGPLAVPVESCTEGVVQNDSAPKNTFEESVKDMQTDEADLEKPSKKMRESDVMFASSKPDPNLANGQTDEKDLSNTNNNHSDPSPAITSHKAKSEGSTKHSPSSSSAREEKIPRTDYVPNKNEEVEEALSTASACSEQSTDKKCVDIQENGKEPDQMDIEHCSDNVLGNSWVLK